MTTCTVCLCRAYVFVCKNKNTLFICWMKTNFYEQQFLIERIHIGEIYHVKVLRLIEWDDKRFRWKINVKYIDIKRSIEVICEAIGSRDTMCDFFVLTFTGVIERYHMAKSMYDTNAMCVWEYSQSQWHCVYNGMFSQRCVTQTHAHNHKESFGFICLF